MADKDAPAYKKYFTYLKDFAYIIGIVVAINGWISSKAANEALLKTTVKQNTEAIKTFNDFMMEQNKLNGKFIQFMESDIHD